MSSMTDFLFARPSFTEGAARLIDFGNFLNEYNTTETANEADARALRSDWLMVGDDLQSALDAFAREHSLDEQRTNGR
jgi:hypothetical protein